MATSPAEGSPDNSNVGGLARRITMTMKEHADSIDRAFDLGCEQGEDNARRLLREEIRQELEDELTGDPNCPLCVSRRELDDLRKRHAVTKLELDRERTNRRQWIRREGVYNYRGVPADYPAGAKPT